jgi:hypothetical protein
VSIFIFYFYFRFSSPVLNFATPKQRQSGKLFIGSIFRETETDLLPCSRFVNVPVDTVNKRLTRESGEATTEISNLEKKLQYHETTNQKSRENLEQILKSGGRA